MKVRKLAKSQKVKCLQHPLYFTVETVDIPMEESSFCEVSLSLF